MTSLRCMIHILSPRGVKPRCIPHRRGPRAECSFNIAGALQLGATSSHVGRRTIKPCASRLWKPVFSWSIKLYLAVRHFRSVVMPCRFMRTNAHAHQCCIFQSYAKTVPSRMKLTMREPASIVMDKGAWRMTSYSNSVLHRFANFVCPPSWRHVETHMKPFLNKRLIHSAKKVPKNVLIWYFLI